jgi:hypothetical protein
MDGLAFQQGADVVAGYRNNAQVLGADLVVALTHYGKEADRKLIDQSFNGSESFEIWLLADTATNCTMRCIEQFQ